MFEGILFKMNEMISAQTIVDNLDPEIYPDPLAFDLARKRGKIATFGAGIPRCPGAIVASMERLHLRRRRAS